MASSHTMGPTGRHKVAENPCRSSNESLVFRLPPSLIVSSAFRNLS